MNEAEAKTDELRSRDFYRRFAFAHFALTLVPIVINMFDSGFSESSFYILFMESRIWIYLALVGISLLKYYVVATDRFILDYKVIPGVY